MTNYFENATARRTTQTILCCVQAILGVSAITFMTLFVTTPAPSEKDFSLCAILFSLAWAVDYFAQLIFACVTNRKIADKNNKDKLFLFTSILFAVAEVAIYGMIVLLFL